MKTRTEEHIIYDSRDAVVAKNIKSDAWFERDFIFRFTPHLLPRILPALFPLSLSLSFKRKFELNCPCVLYLVSKWIEI